MSGQGPSPAAVSSTCPACGAGMEFDPDTAVLRCPYCRHEMLTSARRPDPDRPVEADGPDEYTVTYVVPEYTPTAKVARVVIPLVGVVAVIGVMIYFLGPSLLPDRDVAVGAAAEAGSFEVTVVSVDCSKQSVAGRPDDKATTYYDESETITAEGTFCLIPLKVTNVGDTTDSYPTYSFEATSATEREFDESYAAATYVNKDKRPLSEPIDPGVTVTQTLVYDIPKGSSIAYLKVFEGHIGPDVKVKIS